MILAEPKTSADPDMWGAALTRLQNTSAESIVAAPIFISW